MPVRLQLLGSPAVECDGESFALPFERRNQLLAYLALRRGWVGRAELAAMLWPEQAASLAYANLRKALFRLQPVRWARGLEAQGGALRFEADTDVFAFEAALRERRVAEAMRLRRGDFLVGFEDGASEAWSSWLQFERERLRSAWREALLAHLDGELDPAEGVELSGRLLEADPLDEAALRARMAWLARSGQGGEARRLYRDFAARLQRELGLEPGSDSKAAHDALVASAVVPAAAITAPRAGDGFVGRSIELRQLAMLLEQGDCRLVTVIGPGGVGKTRLARRALADLAGDPGTTAAFVALEDADAAEQVPARIALELAIPLAARRDCLAQVIDYLRERPALLVLDNFEQLAAGAALLEAMLEACPRLKLVVTSRVRLALASEQLLPLGGLPCPDPEDQDRFEAFDAVRLFVKAAHRVEPALVPEAEAAAIAEICRQVEGLPLALELAAAWTRVLSCEAIAANLREGAGLLHAADPARPPRQASIEVVFEQSWRLLSPVERDALARLAAFHGSFGAEAARAVANAGAPVLGALVDKSLLSKQDRRMHLHPLLQQLAAARLAAGDDHDRTLQAHAMHFLRSMARLRRGVEHGEREALNTMEADWHDCRAAWRWAAAHAAGDLLAGSMPALLHFCDHRHRPVEGLALLREAIASPAAARTPLGPALEAAAAHLEYRLDRYAEAQASAARALAGSGSGHAETRLQCLKVLGSCALRLGQLDEARRHFRQALKQAPAGFDPGTAAAMLDNLALVEKHAARYPEALSLANESLVRHRLLNDAAGEALCLNNLGALCLDMGEHGAALGHLRASLALCDLHGLVATRALVFANLAELAIESGDTDAAEAHARRALEANEASGNRALAAWIRLQLAHAAIRKRDFEAARAGLGAALELAIAVGRPAHQFAGLRCFAQLLTAEGEVAGARAVLAFAAAHPAIGAPERAQALALLAKLAGDTPAWPGLDLAELVHRIVVEAPVAHGPLLARLRGAIR